MSRLADNSWGKTSVRVSKIHRGPDADGFSELTADIQLQGEVDAAFRDGDNAGVWPTDTMRNTVYGLAQEHLDKDVEGFARVLAAHFVAKEGVHAAAVDLASRQWQRVSPHGFLGGSSETRTARVENSDGEESVWGGIDGLVVLKTTNSAFAGYPKDEYTVLPETDDRILATTVTATWRYAAPPADTSATWNRVREVLIERFFADWSASVQHQGWLMGEAVLAAVPEIGEISFRLPNQHHITFNLERFGVPENGIVFQPVAEPYGDIRFTVSR